MLPDRVILFTAFCARAFSTVLSVALFVALFAALASPPALAWKPYKSWRDSYSVDGICYCDSSNFDHGIGDVLVQTPDGYQRSVRQICADITNRYGVGEASGRIPYNTIACGHGPANNAPDEDLTSGCPGRVDMGEAGCFELGPKWPFAELYGAAMKTLDRSVWKITVSHGQYSSSAMTDGNTATRWSTNAKQAAGQWIEVDLGGEFDINIIDLDSKASFYDAPAGWLVETSLDGKEWLVISRQDSPAEAKAQTAREVTRIEFPVVSSRHLRITQTGVSSKYFWSVHELNIGNLKDD